MGRFKLFLPLLVFIVRGILLVRALQLDPAEMPSALLDRPLPEFELQSLQDPERILSRDDVLGQKMLINVWATWCPSCKVEHPWLVKIAQQYGVKIIGLNYKDERQAALGWLQRYEDPFAVSVYDVEGRLGLDMGVYGAPETFVVDSAGIIRFKHVGVIDESVWQDVLLPVLQEIN
jgi:cytochrome c biogenesis protein CcmG, thiol:disulfide interchange protein DsbE